MDARALLKDAEDANTLREDDLYDARNRKGADPDLVTAVGRLSRSTIEDEAVSITFDTHDAHASTPNQKVFGGRLHHVRHVRGFSASNGAVIASYEITFGTLFTEDLTAINGAVLRTHDITFGTLGATL